VKKLAILCVLLSLAAFILLPASQASKRNSSNAVLADGWPLPPPIPPNASMDNLVADGWPLPPPIPPNTSMNTLVADGWPLPPPIPPSKETGTARPYLV